MKKIEQLTIKQYKAKKGETIVHLFISFADQMVTMKNKINELIESYNQLIEKIDREG